MAIRLPLTRRPRHPVRARPSGDTGLLFGGDPRGFTIPPIEAPRLASFSTPCASFLPAAPPVKNMDWK